jgi:predicted membrane protein
MPDEQRRAYLLVHFRTTLLIWAACTTIFHGLTLSQVRKGRGSVQQGAFWNIDPPYTLLLLARRHNTAGTTMLAA